MQLVHLNYNGRIYDLGHILPVLYGHDVKYVVIPNFDYRPPFFHLRLCDAHSRMSRLGVKHLSNGGMISKMIVGNHNARTRLEISPTHVIEYKEL